jgi:S-adenosylmethionine-diacylglycerol 3-amino-3-carboxypropyl transferase
MRLTLPASIDGRLFFAQVREDPRLELELLHPGPNDSIVVIGSGGCTALSLLAAGAGSVTAVDLNRTQNHLIELKLAAIATLEYRETLAFLGATDGAPLDRIDAYAILRPRLTAPACAYWDARLPDIASGVLAVGVTEKFVRQVVLALRLFVHPRSRIDRMLAATSVDEQRMLFEQEWNTTRWRLFFRLLLNRAVFRRKYDPAFFAQLSRPSFADHFRKRAEQTLTELPVRDNYFLHHMLTGRYPVDVCDGTPPYLSRAGYAAVASASDRLAVVDGTMSEYLHTLAPRTVTGFVLSNIGEWLAPNELDALFGEVARTAVPGATLCFRNFVGWTEIPSRYRGVIVEDRDRGERMMPHERSVVQRRIAACRVYGEAAA